jgi:hypothetical protein
VHVDPDGLTAKRNSKCCLGATLRVVQTTFEPTDKQNLYLRQPLGVYYARGYPLELIKTAVQAAEKAGDVDISDDRRTVTGADVIAARNRAEFEKLDGQIQAGWDQVEKKRCIHVAVLELIDARNRGSLKARLDADARRTPNSYLLSLRRPAARGSLF